VDLRGRVGRSSGQATDRSPVRAPRRRKGWH